jgi:hypothetical protein
MSITALIYVILTSINVVNVFCIIVLRVKDMTLASKLITCGVILHNLAIEFGDDCNRFREDEEDEPQSDLLMDDQGEVPPPRAQREQRRNQFLRFFTRNSD